MIVYSLWTLAAVEWAECLGGTCHDGFDSLQRGDSFHTALCAVYTLLKASQGSSPWGLDSLWLVYLSTYSQLSSLWYLCSHFTAHIVIGTWDDSSYWFCYGFVGFFLVLGWFFLLLIQTTDFATDWVFISLEFHLFTFPWQKLPGCTLICVHVT